MIDRLDGEQCRVRFLLMSVIGRRCGTGNSHPCRKPLLEARGQSFVSRHSERVVHPCSPATCNLPEQVHDVGYMHGIGPSTALWPWCESIVPHRFSARGTPMTCRKGLTARRCEGAGLAPGHYSLPMRACMGKPSISLLLEGACPARSVASSSSFLPSPTPSPPLSASTPSAVLPSAWRKRLQEATLPSTISITIMHISPVGAFLLSMRTSADP